jgi:DNA polymerase III subunit epsilon
LPPASPERALQRVKLRAAHADDAATKRLGLIVNVETTGLDPARDKIIEIAVLPFDFSSEGVLYGVHEGYAGFEVPVRRCPRWSSG